MRNTSSVNIIFQFGNSLTWKLALVSKQLRLLRGRVGDSTALVNSLSPKMSLLVEDAVAFCCCDIVRHIRLIRKSSRNLSCSNLNFSDLTFSMSLRYFGNELYTTEAQTQLLHFLEEIVLGFCL